MTCPRCGLDNPPGKVVCGRCGTRLRPAAGTSRGPVSSSPELFMTRLRGDLVRLALVTVVVLAVAMALGLRFR